MSLPLWAILLLAAVRLPTVIVPVCWMLRDLCRLFGHEPPELINDLYFNVKPFFLPALTVATGYDVYAGIMGPLDYVLTPVAFAFGFFIRNDKDDEDRWKRRREKVAAKVQEQGGKLVVVPVGANA